MADIDRSNSENTASKPAGGANARSSAAKKIDSRVEHHLRGAEFDDDFTDAEQDSCTATHRRNDRESDS